MKMEEIRLDLTDRARKLEWIGRADRRVDRRRNARGAAHVDAVHGLTRRSPDSGPLMNERRDRVAARRGPFAQRLRIALDAAALGRVILAEMQDAHAASGSVRGVVARRAHRRAAGAEPFDFLFEDRELLREAPDLPFLL